MACHFLLDFVKYIFMFQKFFLIGLLFFLGACAHLDQRIHNLPLKSSRSKVLKTLGRPHVVQRKEGYDYWTYKFEIEGRHYTRTIVIRDGMLYKKERLKPYSLKSF